MARDSHFVCQECGHSALAWTGRCPGCGEWNTLAEAKRPTGGASRRGGSKGPMASVPRPVPLREVQAPKDGRLLTGIAELDRVLGGGLVPGSVVLLGGSPGIGKSTLTGMALGNLAARGGKVLYVSGEESAAQVRLRAERLGGHALSVPALAETSVESVVAVLDAEQPAVCVIDSVQTLHSEGMTGAPGSVGQVREAAGAVTEVGKRLGIAVVLVGHVTKDGSVAGPRVLEHLVDCVLLFEGERERSYRTLRALKNRFGATNEVGRLRDALRRPGGGRRPVGAVRGRGLGRAGVMRPVRDGGHSSPAGGGPGTRGTHRDRSPAARRDRDRPQPARHGARGPRPPRRALAGVRRRLRERGWRRAGR